jgi:drug/metabolite transporter (DMT)-like permease
MAAMKPLLGPLTPLELAWLRVMPAGAAILIAAKILKRPLGIEQRDRGWFLLFTLVDCAVFQGLLAEGLQQTGAGLGSVLIDSQPLIVALLARFLLGDLINPVGWVGLLLGLGGILCLGLPAGVLQHWLLEGPPVLTGAMPQLGELLMLFAAAAMAVGTLLCRWACRHSDPLAVTGWHLLIGGLPLLGLSLINSPRVIPTLNLAQWGLMAYSSLLGSALAYGLFFWFANQGDLTGFTSLTFLTPVFALASGFVWLDEHLRLLQWIGVVLALGSVVLINQRGALWASHQEIEP